MTQFAAYQGTELRCQNWRAEALLRLLENVLDVGERPEGLVIYASIGKAARDWGAYNQIVDALKKIREDQTLILQTGRPVAVLNTHPAAPMVMSAVNNTVGVWANEDKFYERFKEGKTIWGGLTAATWQYISRLLHGFSAGGELGSAASGLATGYPSADVCTGNLSALQDYGGSAPRRWLCQSVCQGSTRGTAPRRRPRARRRFRNGNPAGQKRKSCPGG